MKPSIYFRPLQPWDIPTFQREVGYYPTSQFNGIVAYTDDGIMGMVGFDRWTATGVEMHWFIKRPRCILPLWNEARAYLRLHGRRKIVGNTPGDNVRALRMIFGRLGFVEKCRIRDGYSEGVDLVISEYTINEQEPAGATGTEPAADASAAANAGADAATAGWPAVAAG